MWKNHKIRRVLVSYVQLLCSQLRVDMLTRKQEEFSDHTVCFGVGSTLNIEGSFWLLITGHYKYGGAGHEIHVPCGDYVLVQNGFAVISFSVYAFNPLLSHLFVSCL